MTSPHSIASRPFRVTMTETPNPFLLPPGGAPAPAPTPTTALPPRPAPARDPEHYIAVPPLVESATHRIARPERTAAETVPESGTGLVADTDPLAEETTLAAPRPVEHVSSEWAIRLPDGVRVPLTGPTVLGRDPASPSDRPGARLLALADSGKTVSKTHALVEPSPGGEGVLVRDLHATNGVTVDVAGARRALPEAGEAIVAAGDLIELGSFVIGVELAD